jgi:hypothetical protein
MKMITDSYVWNSFPNNTLVFPRFSHSSDRNMIFGMATRIFGDMIDPAPPYHIKASPHRWPTDVAEKHEVALIKLRLPLVCRSWRQMATEFLYENIRIYHRFDLTLRRCTRATALRWTLEASAFTRGDRDNGSGIKSSSARQVEGRLDVLSNDMGYGRWVKQLAFHMDYISVEDVAAIIDHCPHLLTLIVSKEICGIKTK